MNDTKQFPSTTADKFVVRLPDGLRDQISELAKLGKRSMNAQIVYMIEFYIEEMRRYEDIERDQKAYEEEMRTSPPENADAIEKLQREFFAAQSELFKSLAKKHGVLLHDLDEKAKADSSTATSTSKKTPT